MLSVYIEDKNDEGSYQCVDSKSETPIKKTIKLLLSKSLFYIPKPIVFIFLFFFYFRESIH